MVAPRHPQSIHPKVPRAGADHCTEPHFYYWGYAWPLHSIVEGSRSILFDLHSRLGLDFGVLFAWCAVNIALFPFACYFMRWKSKRGMNPYYR